MMEILEFVKRPVDGKIIIQLPEGWEGREVIIKVSDKITESNNRADLAGKQKASVLKQLAGTAKYPDTSTDKYEVYEQ